MEVFLFIGFYFIPIFAYIFIVALLRAIDKIVKGKPYTGELFWSGLLFAIIIWTITMSIMLTSE